MKKLVILGGMLALVLSSCGTKKSGGNLKTADDSIAYVIGMYFGESIKSNGDSTLNIDILLDGLKGTLDGKTVMDKEQAMAFMREYYSVIKPERAKKESAAFLEKVAKDNKNVQKTESGLMYEIVEPGDANVKAKATDKVKAIYVGKLKDGSEFDNSNKHGDTVEFALNQVIPGWTEGLQLIGKGGKIKLWIPAELGYGDNPNGPGGGNQALMFDVELVDVIPVDTTATK